ncbi:MAG: hypothetical protein ABW146_07955 [Candidatus Sedimenticola sp. 6PFRAG7]
MEPEEFKTKFLHCYLQQDIGGLIAATSSFKNEPGFEHLRIKLIESNYLASHGNTIEEIVQALIMETEHSLSQQAEPDVDNNFFEVGEKLKKHFEKEISNLYLDTWMPNDLILSIREKGNPNNKIKLTESIIRSHKNEYVRIRKGLNALIKATQPYSSFPISHSNMLGELLSKLFTELGFNKKYVLARPFILQIIRIGESDGRETPIDTDELDETDFTFFHHYASSGIEPSVSTKVELHIAIHKLFICIANEQLLGEKILGQFQTEISKLISYKSPVKLPTRLNRIFHDLILQVDSDQSTIMKYLAESFMDEYGRAEVDMLSRYQLIENELLYTIEYFERVKTGQHRANPKHEEKVMLAREKLLFLQDVFPLLGLKREELSEVNSTSLERSAFGVSSEITPAQLTEWIRIYSILFSNRDIAIYAGQEIDFTVMRNLISHLTTYHLVHNITLLRNVVDKKISAPDEEKRKRFQLFNEALKLKLEGLMSPGKKEDKTLLDMIDDLGFIKDEKVQFIIADTFHGFQVIVDSFNASANDYFVQDREKLMQESRGLYSDICVMCMKGLVHRSKESLNVKADTNNQLQQGKTGWLNRIFSK